MDSSTTSRSGRASNRFAAPLLVAVLLGAVVRPSFAQLDPNVRDRVISASVQIAVMVDSTERGRTERTYFPVGSGTVVTPDGLILTNWHVTDMNLHGSSIADWEQQLQSDGRKVSIAIDRSSLLVLLPDRDGQPAPRYTAVVEQADDRLDLAVLRITGDERGSALSPSNIDLTTVPIGDSDSVSLGDAIDIFGYPGVGGDSLTYSSGVVSGFLREDGLGNRAWIKTDAVLSGGSSGGAAIDRTGRLIGIPTQGASLDCRPGDTDGNGTVDAQDIGCVPTGGSIGQLRPTNLALPLLKQAGVSLGNEVADVPRVPSPTPAAPPPTATPARMSVTCGDGFHGDFQWGDRVLVINWSEPGGGPMEQRTLDDPRRWTDDFPALSQDDLTRALADLPVPVPPFDLLSLPGVHNYPGPSTVMLMRNGVGFVLPFNGVVEVVSPAYLCHWPVREVMTGLVGMSKLANAYGELVRCQPLKPGGIGGEPECTPDFPGRSLTAEDRRYCPTAPLHSPGDRVTTATQIVLDAPQVNWQPVAPIVLDSGSQLEIAGPMIEAGTCDYWPVYVINPQTGMADPEQRGFLPEEALRPRP
jgi:S1-C subfamily serine protease